MSNSPSARLIQRDARQSFASLYPFEPSNGGLGVSLACSTSVAQGVLVGDGPVAVLTNPGSVCVFVAFGTSGVTATTQCFPVLPGTQTAVSIPQDGTVTHVSSITAGGSTTLSVHLGFGN